MKKAFSFLRAFLAAGVLLGLMTGFALAKEPASEKGKRESLAKTAAYQPDIYQILNINNLWSWHRRDGQANHSPTGDNGTFYPRGTAWTIYQDGLVFGSRAYVDAQKSRPAPFGQITRVGGATYATGQRQGWVTGLGATAQFVDPADPRARIYRVRRDWKEMSADELRRDAAESNEIAASTVTAAQMQQIADRYLKDWKEWPVDLGAPYIDRNGNGKYDPPPDNFTVADLIDKKYDEPGIAGADPNSPADQVLWCVFNDLHRPTSTGRFGSEPSGLEIQMTMWGYKRTDALGNMFFRKWRIINKGGVDIDAAGTKGGLYLDSMYVCQWSDPDLGSFSDDLTGCDTTLSLGFIYNGNAVDTDYRKFNLPPPSAGYDFLQGPIVPSPGSRAVFDLKYRNNFKNLGMVGFSYFSAGSPYSDPTGGYTTNTIRWYKMLRGFAPLDGPDVRYNHPPGVTPGPYPLAGDPVKGTGHVDGKGTNFSFVPGDRRLLIITGPFKLALGDTQEVVVACVMGLGADRLSSISVMKFNDRFAQNTYNALFRVPKAPAAPDVKVAQLDGQLVLEWGSNLARVREIETTVNEPGAYKFEGYNVYQFRTPNASLKDGKRLATYDLLDDPAVILDEQFDPASGQILQLPAQFGSNGGIQRYFVINRDFIKDVDKLNNGEEYYFGVTAYSKATEPGYLPAALESPLQILTIIPQSPRLGQRINDKVGQEVVVKHTAGLSDVASLPITVIDPSRTKAADYRISISAATGGGLQWTLRNVTAGQDVLTSREFGSADTGNLNDDNNFPIADGLLLKVAQISPDLIDDSTRFSQASPWLRGGDRFTGGDPAAPAGNTFVTTGEDLGNRYLGQFGSSWDPRDNYPVLVRFGPNNKQKAYRLRRTGPGTEYVIQATNPTPEINVTAFDVRNPAAPRQLTLSWRDQDNNGTWNPTATSDGVEILFIHDRTYDPTMSQYAHAGNGQTAINNECTVGAKADIMYGISCRLVEGATLNQSDLTMRIRPALRLAAGDVYSFSMGGVTTSAELAIQDLRKVGVFPNPYFGLNPQETNRLARFVTFNNLPDDAVIRIFNLAGQLVRTIDHKQEGGGPFRRWNLLNHSNLPVASGLYVAHIEMPGIGEKVLKLVIVQEAEVLETF
ncbi:MAG: T9SS type A sorting domain-containing protein [candidate division KSB1 bacterium]|nr:T9SS type A sorting domain-containing protein [candidate division KSB1 bacterium]MDZ7365292.1 T9SS type A sorting domain-containing protein [candidate division KSB1 bacterium]MDZ7403159.1 T9SS type A sorting domain-containing protein [candidate division KSB1 bacterium]